MSLIFLLANQICHYYISMYLISPSSVERWDSKKAIQNVVI